MLQMCTECEISFALLCKFREHAIRRYYLYFHDYSFNPGLCCLLRIDFENAILVFQLSLEEILLVQRQSWNSRKALTIDLRDLILALVLQLNNKII